MPRRSLSFTLVFLCVACLSCSPRDFLTRRLAADLIIASDGFKAMQQFLLRTGVVSNKDFVAPESLVLQHSGWISGQTLKCPPDISPPPCWEVVLTPLGVEAFRDWVQGGDANRQFFSVPTAKRELVAITGIIKDGNLADVEFTWKWSPVNEVGAALYAGNVQYKSTVGFKHYDDGWRLVEGTGTPASPGLDEALKNSEPVP